MSLKDTLKSLLGLGSSTLDKNSGFHVQADSNGLNFYLEKSELDALELGNSDSSLKLIQLVVLNMLLEQGLAERFPNGFHVDQNQVAAMDDEQSELLQLPPQFPGSFGSSISGRTGNANFDVQLSVLIDGVAYPFERKGPFLYLSDSESYRLTPAELSALVAWDEHRSIPLGTRSETHNLKLMARMQMAVQSGMRLDLSHFERLNVVTPHNIGVSATRLPDGSLELCPTLGEGFSADDLNSRWGQLDPEAEGGALRVGNRLVLLESEKLSAVREVLKNRRIPADRVQDFIATPTAFINAALVNLDIGFSLRVAGIGKLVHIDFGTLDTVRRDWFGASTIPGDPSLVLSQLTSPEDIARFEERFREAAKQGAGAMGWDDQLVDISDTARVEEMIADAKAAIHSINEKTSIRDKDVPVKTETVTLLLKDAEQVGKTLLDKASKATETPIRWDRFARDPFPHQRDGVAWMKSLLEQALEDDHSDLFRIQGALLADDMGLGKTYMALVALGEYLERQKDKGLQCKPLLVVAPLSLLENWEDEVFKTFKTVPFRDVVVLQSGRDLKRFRVKGAERESVQSASALDDEGRIAGDAIRYALHVGPDAGPQRLDMERRLVLTTYQTLRDYQFSLCCIDWGVVIFDEAQNIKNPNTLQTRAAKGLKSDFKLLATGTPVENSLGDFWCLMDSAQPGLLGDWPAFRDTWIKPIVDAGPDQRDQIRAEIGRQLRDAVGRFMLRRTKEDQLKGLPKKNIYSGAPQPETGPIMFDKNLSRSMRDAQLAAYDAILDGYRKQKSREDMRGRALAALQKLRSVSLHPRIDENLAVQVGNPKQSMALLSESAKLQVLLGILDDIRSRNEKVILFMMTKRLQMMLKCALDSIYQLNISIINGDTAAVQTKSESLSRKGLIEKFESVSGFNILIMSPIAAGVGLTVVGANHVVHIERHWNPAKEAQATDRVYRIGQTKEVHIYLPVSVHPGLDSFDLHLDRLLRGKLMLKDAVVTPEVISEEEMIRSMGL